MRSLESALSHQKSPEYTRRTRNKEIKVKKRGTFNIDNDSKKYLLKSCAALYKENCRFYVNFHSKTESKMVIFAQMKPPITNPNLNKLVA